MKGTVMIKNFIITQIDDSQNLDWCDILVHDTDKSILKFKTERDAQKYLVEEAELTPLEIISNNIFIAQLH
tara:strand:+ start:744 stop:956 length:213 start_codon:yes stop_codon:yes gene_type:complete